MHYIIISFQQNQMVFQKKETALQVGSLSQPIALKLNNICKFMLNILAQLMWEKPNLQWLTATSWMCASLCAKVVGLNTACGIY